LTLRISIFDADAVSFGPPKVPETLAERIYLSRDRGVDLARQKAYSTRFFQFLLSE
jgi:hypothetical protein